MLWLWLCVDGKKEGRKKRGEGGRTSTFMQAQRLILLGLVTYSAVSVQVSGRLNPS